MISLLTFPRPGRARSRATVFPGPPAEGGPLRPSPAPPAHCSSMGWLAGPPGWGSPVIHITPGKEWRMKISKSWIRLAVPGALLLALIGGPLAFAGPGDVIHNGVDLWMTVAGFAQTSFASDPLPAGFFCAGSQPFTGKVVFKGVPLAARPAKSLGDIDTVVRRLDDAAFNKQGEATTRIQLLALS